MVTRRERFGEFYNRVAEKIKVSHPEVGFYGYGSYFEKPNQEPSDIDGGIVMPTLITDKPTILSISEEIAKQTERLGIQRQDIQINLLDHETNRDGRFLSYSTDYALYLRMFARVLAGDPKLEDLNGIDNRYNTHESTAFNFRRVRNSLLMSYSSYYAGNEVLDMQFAKLIDQVKRLPKKMLQFGLIRDLISTGRKNEIHREIANLVGKTSKEDALRDLGKLVGDVDLSFFDRIKDYEDPETVRKLFADGILFLVWGEALETYESIVKGYVENNPPLVLQVRTVI
jgi:hypothetical protein